MSRCIQCTCSLLSPRRQRRAESSWWRLHGRKWVHEASWLAAEEFTPKSSIGPFLANVGRFSWVEVSHSATLLRRGRSTGHAAGWCVFPKLREDSGPVKYAFVENHINGNWNWSSTSNSCKHRTLKGKSKKNWRTCERLKQRCRPDESRTQEKAKLAAEFENCLCNERGGAARRIVYWG